MPKRKATPRGKRAASPRVRSGSRRLQPPTRSRGATDVTSEELADFHRRLLEDPETQKRWAEHMRKVWFQDAAEA